MSSATLHYIYDPLCGWCYAAAPLVEAANQLVPIQLHGGGMMTGTRRQKITPAWRDYVRPQDLQIGHATGKHFAKAYLDGLLNDQSAVLDSGPPTAAILAAQELDGAGLEMLARLHKAHYVQGRRIANEEVLVEIASAIGLDRTPFLTSLRTIFSRNTRSSLHGEPQAPECEWRDWISDLRSGAGWRLSATRPRAVYRTASRLA